MSSWTLRPLSGALGAELTDLDVQRLDESAVADLRDALLEHQVLAIRDQRLDPPALSRFAARLGTPAVYPFSDALPEDPYVVPIVKQPEDREVFGGIWHTDSSYLEKPPSLTLLYAVETPDRGGDTLYADMYAVYEGLSEALQTSLETLRGVFTATLVHSVSGEFADAAGADRNRREPDDPPDDVLHPVVRTHPETGRKAIYTSLAHTRRFEGFSRGESLPLLGLLADRVSRPEFCSRLSWRPGTLTLWDNRCVQHYPINDYPGRRRVMHRVIVEGERPA